MTHEMWGGKQRATGLDPAALILEPYICGDR
jgi:hypothetical protein